MAIDNLSELIKRTMIQTMRQLRVSMPCEVVRYNSKRQMVDVRIVQPEIDLAGNNIPMPVITNIPVSFVRCGNSHITHPINKGDTGFIVFADRDISSWVETNNTSVVDSSRTHSMQDSYFVPGIVGGGTNANPNDVEIKYNNTTIHLRKNGDVDINTPSKVNINASSEVNVTTTNAHVVANQIVVDCPNTYFNGKVWVSQLLTTAGFTSTGVYGDSIARFVGSVDITQNVNIHNDLRTDNNVSIGASLDVEDNVTVGNVVTAGNEVTAKTINLTTHTHNYSSGGGTTTVPNS